MTDPEVVASPLATQDTFISEIVKQLVTDFTAACKSRDKVAFLEGHSHFISTRYGVMTLAWYPNHFQLQAAGFEVEP